MEGFFAVVLLSLIITESQQQLHHRSVVDLDEGSGYSFSGDDDTDDYDDEVTQSTRTEGSGDPIFGVDRDDDEGMPLTPCQRQRLAPGAGAFRPQCSSDGKFKPTQCDSKRCWCVDKGGMKTLGSERSLPSRPKCSSKGSEIFVLTRRPPDFAAPDFAPEEHVTDDITIDEPSTFRPMYSERTPTRKTSKVQTTTDHDMEEDDEASDVAVQRPAFFSFLLKDPLIFAGIVGGAVLALLCFVLLVMFAIYQMRKKDEGSYALDEPKKSFGFAYTRASDKEFFA